MTSRFPRSLPLLCLLLAPGAARADALDALVIVAYGILAVWAIFALPLLGYAVFGEAATDGGRMILSVLLCLSWGPAVVFAFGLAPPLGMVLGVLVAFAMYRVWRALPLEQ